MPTSCSSRPLPDGDGPSGATASGLRRGRPTHRLLLHWRPPLSGFRQTAWTGRSWSIGRLNGRTACLSPPPDSGSRKLRAEFIRRQKAQDSIRQHEFLRRDKANGNAYDIEQQIRALKRRN